MDVKKIARLGVLLALSIVFSIIESFIPSVPIPGVKLGLASVVTLIVLYLYGTKDALLILLLRIFLVSILIGKLFSFGFYLSLSGGMLAFFLMVITKKIKVFSIYGVSVAGAVGHAIGQIVLASILLSTFSLLYYLPIMALLSVFTGLLTALVSEKVKKQLE